ncbi:hypothetical protein JCM6882_006930 [Rhodosporidiobolus microsporus]
MTPLIQVAASSTEQQWYYTRQELARPPSVREGMKLSQERRLRQKAVKTIWKFKDALFLKQATITTAATLMHRFYMRETFQQYDYLLGAAAATFLASKSEEEPRSLKTLTQFVLDMRRGTYNGQKRAPETSRPEFTDLRRKITLVEETMLRAMCFDLTVRDPHWVALKTVKRVWKEDEAGTNVARVAWAFLNDVLYHPLCLFHRPHLLAAASLLLACAQLSLPLPPRPLSLDEQRTLHETDAEEGEEAPPFVPEVYWLDLLDVRKEELEAAVEDLLDGYKVAQEAFVQQQAVQLATLVTPLFASLSPSPSSTSTTAPASASTATTSTITDAAKGLDALGGALTAVEGEGVVKMDVDPPA